MEKVLNESVGRLAKEIRKSGLKPEIVSQLDKSNVHSELPEVNLNGKKTPGDLGKVFDIAKKSHGHEASKYLASSKKRPERELDYDREKMFDALRASDIRTALSHKEIAKEYQKDANRYKKKESKPLTKIKNKLNKDKDESYPVSKVAPIGQVNKMAKAVRAIQNKDKANSLGLTPKELRTKMYEKKNKNTQGQ